MINDVENLPVFPSQLYIFYGEQHIQTLVQHLFSIELLRFSLEKCMYSYPCKVVTQFLGVHDPLDISLWV